MLGYLTRRVQTGLSVLFVISLLAFGLNAITPGDPALHVLQTRGIQAPSASDLAGVRAELHLDNPLPVQYATWLGRALRGDFGRSYVSGEAVAGLYLQRIKNTALLAACATLLSVLVAIPLGTLAAYRRGGLLDGAAQLVAVLGSAVPGFWIGLLAVSLFAVRLHWLPAFGSPNPRGIVLPAAVLALANVAILTRLTRAAVLDVLHQDYVRVARAKGLAALPIARRHVLRNALVPVCTVLGLECANLMTGAAVVEYIFAWPGIGKLAVDSALLRDAPVVIGFTVAAGVIFVAANLIVDVALAALDPRMRAA